MHFKYSWAFFGSSDEQLQFWNVSENNHHPNHGFSQKLKTSFWRQTFVKLFRDTPQELLTMACQMYMLRNYNYALFVYGVVWQVVFAERHQEKLVMLVYVYFSSLS